MQIELSELVQAVGGKDQSVPFEVGRAYLICCVTRYHVGRVKAVLGGFLVLEEASWVQDTGRWNDALRTGDMTAIEPTNGLAYINLDSIVDATDWNHKLPTEQK